MDYIWYSGIDFKSLLKYNMKNKNKWLILFFSLISVLGLNLVLADSGDIWTWTVWTWDTESTWTVTTTSNDDFQIVIDPITKKITIISWTWQTNTWTTINTGTTISTWTSEEVDEDTTVVEEDVNSWASEFQLALNWMFGNGLTKYDTQTAYRPYDGLTREEAAKIIGQAYSIFGYEDKVKNSDCTFTDMNQVDPTLSGYVMNVCKRWLFKWSNGKFNPKWVLTRPQAMAVIIRMFEWKVSFEQWQLRWSDYYLKGKALWLTSVATFDAYDTMISRYEIWLYIYRLKKILDTDASKNAWLNKIWTIDGSESVTTTWNTVDSGTIADYFSSLTNSTSISEDPELKEAISWMNDNGLTTFKTVQTYMPFEILTREQASKILDIFANVFGLKDNMWTKNTECTFTDINTADASLTTHIKNVCAMGILKWWNGKFNPKWTITKAQFITAMIRLFQWWSLDETTNPRWLNYFTKAKELWMVSASDSINFENNITRYEVALFIYRFKVKYQMLQSLNDSKIENQVVTTVEDSIITGLNNMLEGQVYVDMNLLQNWSFEIGYLEVLENRYKLAKSTTEKYFANNFVRYGDVYDMENDEQTWTVSFIVSNGYLVEWTIRIGDSSYQIIPIANTSTYYRIKQIK